MNSKFFFFLRIEIDIFRHETNLTSETWQTFFFHFEDARETSELHQVRGKEIFQQVSVWLKSWHKPRNSGLTGVVLISISPRGIRYGLLSLTVIHLSSRFALYRKICILFCNSGSFRSLGFTLFLSFLPCATNHFINMKVSWRRWNSKTSQSEISSPVKTNDTNDITSCHGMYVAIPFSLFSSLFSFSFSSGFFFAFLLILLYPIFHSLRWDFR